MASNADLEQECEKILSDKELFNDYVQQYDSTSVFQDLEQECEKILSDKELFNDYVARMNHWMRQNNGRVIDLFRKFDKNGDSVVSYEEFKEGMQRLGAPCSLAELHLLAKLLDTDNSRTIDYMEFSKGLRYMRKI